MSQLSAQAPDDETRILLLTGVPGIGKTTLVRKVAARLQQYRLAGFYTEEIRESGQRQGFRLVTFNGEHGIIAHVDFNHQYSVGKYGVDVGAIDAFADAALAIADDIDVYIIDEIGKMECLSPRFVWSMKRLLDSDKTMIATVGKKGRGLIDKAKRWQRSLLWEITHANRDALVSQVVTWCGGRV